MNIKEGVAVAVGCASLIGTGYALARSGGWIIDEAGASSIATQSALYAVSLEEKARLEFIRETKYSRLQFLNRLQARSPDDDLEMETLRADIARIDERIAEIDEQAKHVN